MARFFIVLAACSGLISVALGAFAAHALKHRLDEYSQGIFQTAVQYQFVHTLALLGVGVLCFLATPTTAVRVSGFSFAVGIVVFSGSLYVLSLTGMRWLGAITPIGGLAFLLGWGSLLLAAWRWPT